MTDNLPINADFDDEMIEVIKTQIMPPGSGSAEFKAFLFTCQQTGLHPLKRQIYPIKRWNSQKKKEIVTPQVSIDGFRIIAERSGLYEGQVGPHWCGPDGVWKDVWLEETPPAAAKVGIYRKGFSMPLYTVALYEEYCQRVGKTDKPTMMWKKMPALMLAKCAESLALRKCFPDHMSGLYTEEEMGQATPEVTITTPGSDDKGMAPQEEPSFDHAAEAKSMQSSTTTEKSKKTEKAAEKPVEPPEEPKAEEEPPATEQPTADPVDPAMAIESDIERRTQKMVEKIDPKDADVSQAPTKGQLVRIMFARGWSKEQIKEKLTMYITQTLKATDYRALTHEQKAAIRDAAIGGKCDHPLPF